MLRDLEVEHGGKAPRIHSMDDYFMTEVEKVCFLIYTLVRMFNFSYMYCMIYEVDHLFIFGITVTSVCLNFYFGSPLSHVVG